jgi:hypothetical protein
LQWHAFFDAGEPTCRRLGSQGRAITVRLSGTFEVLPFPALLELMIDQRATGRLSIRTGDSHVLIRLIEGEAVAAAGVVRGASSRK